MACLGRGLRSPSASSFFNSFGLKYTCDPSPRIQPSYMTEPRYTMDRIANSCPVGIVTQFSGALWSLHQADA